MDWNDLQDLVPAAGSTPDFEACLDAFPGLRALRSARQSPRWHAEGDTWTHTKMVVRALIDGAAYAALPRASQEVLFLAALLHDIAKATTEALNPLTGEIGHPGHSKKGAIDARIALWDAGTPFAQREAVCRLIESHQRPFHAFEPSRAGITPEFAVRELSWRVDLHLLAMLAEADMRGRVCADQEKVLVAIELFRELAREEGCYGRPRAFADTHTAISYFRGANVHPDYALFQEHGSRVTIMSGLPASGKNQWVTEHRPDLPVVSYDDSRLELGLAHGRAEGKVAHHALDKAKDLLRAKAPFVWNATHLSGQLRSKALDLCYAYNAEVDLVYLEAPRAELLRRNNARDTSLTNKALLGMLHRWEVPSPTEAHTVTYLAG